MSNNRLAIVGYRGMTDYDFLKEKVQEFEKTHNITTIVSGGAEGADSLAERYINEFNKKPLIFEADWDKYETAAGPIRNTLIVENSDFLIAFPSRKSKGTFDSINKAKKKGIPVLVFYID